MKLVFYPAAAQAAASPATPGRARGVPSLVTQRDRAGGQGTEGKGRRPGPRCAAVVPCPPALWQGVDRASPLGIH